MSEENEEDKKIGEAILQIIKTHGNDILEHVDTIQIFCSVHGVTDKETRNVNWGSGNWNARFGQVKAWVIRQEETFKIDARKDEKEDDL